jgi:hypothetical protein
MNDELDYRTITSEQVLAETGKCWAEWLAILDAYHARYKNFVTVAYHLKKRYELSGVWARTIARYYAWEHQGRP